MRVVVPYAEGQPKTRLATMLTERERESLARRMLADVREAILATDHEPEVLSPEPLPGVDGTVLVDERPLSDAVNGVLARSVEPVAVVMADLALTTPAALRKLFAADGDVVLVPGRGGGTNALVARDPAFRVDYHGTSYLDHLAIARDIGATVTELDSYRLGTDIDEPADLTELLIHEPTSRAGEWLAAIGLRLSTTEGRVTVKRERGEDDE